MPPAKRGEAQCHFAPAWSIADQPYPLFVLSLRVDADARIETDPVLDLLLIGQLLATVYMTGLIWFVQIVHYPLLAWVDEAGFPAYEAKHQQRTTWVVAPPMLVELLTAMALLGWAEAIGGWWIALINLASVIVIWLSTALVQMPLHAQLTHARDLKRIRRLVMTNWLRTALWTGRSALVVTLCMTALSA
jgi:hypothetical protein